MKVRLFFYACVLTSGLIVSAFSRFCLPDTPPPSRALTAADVQAYRVFLENQTAILKTPSVTNINARPHSARDEALAAS